MEFLEGGFQGARGANDGGGWYIENVFEELDYPNEYFFNQSESILYYFYNNTSSNSVKTLQNLIFEATKWKILMNISNANNITVNGVTFMDTAYTYMDPHGMPSAGDWALERQGSIYIKNCENISITNNMFTRIDGNGISINSYNRDHLIHNNVINSIGGSGITLWGDTSGITLYSKYTNSDSKFGYNTIGYDGTNGNQPRKINISSNIINNVGIWEKQSAMIFSAKSCQNIIEKNIFYNSPRDGILFNDGFGGGTLIDKNLIFNVCKETECGPFYSWDRQPFAWDTNGDSNNVNSMRKQYDNFTRNFLIGNYDSDLAVDNDDGSCYYAASNNFFPYSHWGLSSDFGGHNNRHYGNIYAYLSLICFRLDLGFIGQKKGYIDAFYNNTCILNVNTISNYGDFNCSAGMDTWPILGNNTIYILNQTNVKNVGLCDMSLPEFQTKYSYDIGTVVRAQPNSTEILIQAKSMLFT